jgi:hypothetical protein
LTINRQNEADPGENTVAGQAGFKDALDCILDIREYDVPYIARINIDFGAL